MILDDLQSCAQQVHKGDSDRFRATMAAKPETRDLLFALYAFNLEVARAPWVTQEPMIAEMRLQWWRDALEEIAEDKDARRHEVVTPLAGLLDFEAAKMLDDLVVARRWDIYKDPFEDQAAFDIHIDHTAGHLMVVAARLVGRSHEATVRDFAYGAGLASWFMAIPELESRGRFPLVDGRPETVQALAQNGLKRLKNARENRAEISRAAGQVMLSGWQASTILQQVSDNPLRVSEGSLGQSEFRKSLSLMARTTTGRW